MSSRRNNQSNSGKGMSPSSIDKFLDNQAKELELRATEYQIHERQINHNYDLAKRSLEAQKDDLKDQRKYKYRNKNSTYIFSCIIVLLILGFLGACLLTDNKEIALTVIEKVTTLALGAIGGYYYGLNKGKKSSGDKYTDYEELDD